MYRKLILLLTLIILIGLAFKFWNTPTRRATRFLDDLSEHVSYSKKANPIALQLRASGFKRYFSDPTEFSVNHQKMGENTSLEKIQSIYLSIARLGNNEITLAFEDINGKDSNGVLSATSVGKFSYKGNSRSENYIKKLKLIWNKENKLTSLIEIQP